MVNLFGLIVRLGLLCASLLLACVGQEAGAAGSIGDTGPPSQTPIYGRNGHQGAAGEVCSALAADDQPRNPDHSLTGVIEGGDPIGAPGGTPFCREYVDGSPSTGWYIYWVGFSTVCHPPTQPGLNGDCYCPGGSKAGAGGTCTPYTCPSHYQYQSSGGASYTWAGMASGAPGCVGGCPVISQLTDVPPGGGVPFSTGGFYSVGGVCDNAGAGAAPSDPKPPDPLNCSGATACSGQVNGTSVCVACGSSSNNSTSGGTNTSADGTVTPGDSTVTNTTDDGTGGVTTTTTVTHSDGSKSTNVVSGPGSLPGTGGGSGSGSGSGTGTCDPTKETCGSDSFGGSCSAQFTCDGDAIQCAIAQEQHVRDCTFYQPDTIIGPIQDDARRFTSARTDGDIPAWSPVASTHVTETALDFSTGLDQSHSFSQSCLADQTFAVPGGGNVVLPWSQFCSSMQLVGAAVVAVAFVACAFIVFGK